MGQHLSLSLSTVNGYALRHSLRAWLCNPGMKTVEQVRRLRLAQLRQQFGSWAKLNAALGMVATDSTFSQIMSPTTKKDMGSDLARRLETACQKELGWMDTDPDLEAARWPFLTVARDAVAGLDAAQMAQLEAVMTALLASSGPSGKQQSAA